MMIKVIVLFLLLAPIALAQQTPPNFKVAFVADHGLSNRARDVFQLIVAEDTDMVLSLGDLGYSSRHSDTPDRFEQMLVDILDPANIPFFAVIGNHDKAQWNDYYPLLLARANASGANCTGLYATKAACTYQGLFFVLSDIGERDHGDYSSSDTEQQRVDFIRTSLISSNALWKICAWHLPRTFMQAGGQINHIGWEAYEVCRQAGAIIATAHEHSYSRTYPMNNISSQNVVTTSNDFALVKEDIIQGVLGQTFVFVSGLGGNSIRPQERNDAWWASIYTSSQGADYGALFCTFHVNNDPNKADCYFKAINGDLPDSFSLTVSGGSPTDPPPNCWTEEITVCE